MRLLLISVTNDIQQIVFFCFLEVLKRGLPRGFIISNSDVDPLYQPAACLMRWILATTDRCRILVWAGTTVDGY